MWGFANFILSNNYDRLFEKNGGNPTTISNITEPKHHQSTGFPCPCL
jgi:hypothetical protein